MDYVDGYVLAVPKANKAAYIELAQEMASIFKEYGALQVVETWADDVPDGKLTSFPLAVKCKDDEAVVFSWVVWPDKATRTSGWEKLHADPRMAEQTKTMPFDGSRLIYGGFNVIINQ